MEYFYSETIEKQTINKVKQDQKSIENEKCDILEKTKLPEDTYTEDVIENMTEEDCNGLHSDSEEERADEIPTTVIEALPLHPGDGESGPLSSNFGRDVYFVYEFYFIL